MLRFVVEVECENDSHSAEELAWLMAHVAAQLYDGKTCGTLRDTNGNRVGNFSFIDGDREERSREDLIDSLADELGIDSGLFSPEKMARLSAVIERHRRNEQEGS